MDSRRKLTFFIEIQMINLRFCLISGDWATFGVEPPSSSDAQPDDRERLRHFQRRKRVRSIAHLDRRWTNCPMVCGLYKNFTSKQVFLDEI